VPAATRAVRLREPQRVADGLGQRLEAVPLEERAPVVAVLAWW
jgi:hypothetical protein